LADIAKQDLAGFAENNPCSAEAAKVQFHRLRSLARGIVVKAYIYEFVSKAVTPEALQAWPADGRVEEFFANMEPEGAVSKWLATLEPLRAAIFDLSQNPLMVWENLGGRKLKRAKIKSVVDRDSA